MAAADFLREDLPLWTQEQFARQEQVQELNDHLAPYDEDEVLLDGQTVRTHRELLLGTQGTGELVRV